MNTPITIPRESANDDVVKIVRWLVKPGDDVRAGSPLLEIETSKAIVDVPAPADGRLVVASPAGAQVPVGGVVGELATIVATRTADVPTPVMTAPARADSNGVARTAPAGPVVSRKAREQLAALGLDTSAVVHLRFVRERDVAALVGGPQTDSVGPASAIRPAVPPIETDWRPGGLLGDARRAASVRGQSVARLAWNYFWRNWLLGNLARIAPRGIITVVHRLRGVRIGHDCFIDPNAILETAYPENVTLGDDVRVTAGAIVMTHIKGPTLLRDRGLVPAVLAPVVLESHSFIGVNAVIMPGVTVGRAAVVASGAVVTSDVPPFTMVAGNPAKVIKRFIGESA
jgi:acetyltransferase-like isoleucine patch superfamily enzyme